MSTFKKNMLAAALVAGLGLAGTAAAYTVYTAPQTGAAGSEADAEDIATQAGSVFAMTQPVTIDIDLGDAVIGRTTGLQIKVTLEGAQFDGVAAPTFTTGDALTGAWNAAYAAGGTEGQTILQFTLEPQAAGSTVSEGELGAFSAFNLQAAPGDVFATVQLIDPVTGTGLHTQRIQLVDRVDGFDFSCTANGDVAQIDVGGNDNFDPKTGLVEFPYEIGGAETDTTSLGDITLDVTGVALDTAAGGDSLFSRISGNFEGFDSVFLAADNTCSTVLGEYTINAAETVATLDEEFAALNTAGGSFDADGGTASLCVTVDGTTQIAAQSFTVVNGFNGTADAGEEVCRVSPLAYNGSVVDVYTINPAGVSTAQSFVRVINPSTVDGTVTFEGWDDMGNKAPVNVTFVLGAGESMQVNSEDLENGNAVKGLTGAWGNGAGKWRARVTGEFSGMRVSSLNRNTTDGTVTNLTDADGHGEQVWDKAFDNGNGFFIP